MRGLLCTLLLAVPACALKTIAVAGATGRVGRMVVERLLADGHAVKAIVRDENKAADVLPSGAECCVVDDLATADTITLKRAIEGAESVIWCASGFAEGGVSVDVSGMTALPSLFKVDNNDDSAATTPPRVVLLSSAGVTRTAWDDAKKERLVGAADIPIIRLNPGGILERKCEAEALLRASGAPYCVVRPTGLKFEGWPAGRPVLSQGDVAVGRTNPRDLADVLVDVLDEVDASGKTFEMFTLSGYPAPRSLGPSLAALQKDAEVVADEDAISATYALLQQLLPGEEQDATKLEMGRTYEEVDAGDVSRERGAAPTEREVALAASALNGGGGAERERRRGLRRLIPWGRA